MKKKLITALGSLQWDGDKPPRDPTWLVKGMFPEVGIGIVAGQWGKGKTYVALDLAAAAGNGSTFAGREVPKRSGVLYVATEGAQTILRRFEFARMQHNVSEPLPFCCARECPKLTSRDALAQLTEAATKIEEVMRQRFGVPLGLIVIDTLMTAAGWESENNNAEVQQVMRLLRELSEETGTFVLGVDHFGKDVSRGVRGGSDKEASADVVLSLTQGQMTLTKCRVGPQGAVMPFELKVHGTEGVWTECSVEWGVERKQVVKVGPLQRAMEKVTPVRIGNRDAYRRAELRKVFQQMHSDKTEGAFKMAWKRAWDAAIENGGVESAHDDEVYFSTT